MAPKPNAARPNTNPVHGQTVEDKPANPTLTPSSSSSGPSARERLASLASHLLPGGNTEFDYVIVGGGTAGAVLANRLTEDRNVSVAVIEGGPTDVGNDMVLDLRRWLEMLGSDLDYDYPTVPQPRGNSFIRHSRARVLGGCSSHNTLISFRPFNADLDDWANNYACPSWSASAVQPYGDRLKMNIVPVAPQQRNQVARDWVLASSRATGAPVLEDFNAHIVHRGGFQKAVGFFDIAYDPYSGQRSSASVAYLHPIMPHGPYKRHNLHLFLETWANTFEYAAHDRTKVTGVRVTTKHGLTKTLTARREVILCAGAIDTPRLLLHSGIGPRRDLEALGLACKHDVPGVGLNLTDHPESIVMWQTRDTPPETVMSSDAGLFLRVLPADAEPHPHPGPDLMFHIYQVPFADNTERVGYERPEHAICMTPNICRSQARGKVSLASADPKDKPLLDFKYFEDADNYDERILIEGVKWARRIAEQSPFKEHLVKEIAPGPKIQSDKDIGEYARKVAHTVYHPAGTCRMGTPSAAHGGKGTDDTVVVDEKDLRIVGLKGVRVCDASVLPTLPTINPMLTILMVAERAAELIRDDAWENGLRKADYH
ncbi:related to Choline dehydrogenase [Sporisorium reilianum SRZ2]|uniref:Related to Choline dehydrogenase n=1 Tax=Sporisorium reilianum (strain SRZ2) TaxID=999809 RepID=E6ZKH9_SPORE|nr:related to Choline dehydrogenase [Sporisorium reilianum SRZ2]